MLEFKDGKCVVTIGEELFYIYEKDGKINVMVGINSELKIKPVSNRWVQIELEESK